MKISLFRQCFQELTGIGTFFLDRAWIYFIYVYWIIYKYSIKPIL